MPTDYKKLGEALGEIAVQVRDLDERAIRLEAERNETITSLRKLVAAVEDHDRDSLMELQEAHAVLAKHGR